MPTNDEHLGTLIAVDTNGRELARYVKEKRLGDGGGAIVYLAQKMLPATEFDDDNTPVEPPHVPRVAIKEALNIPTWKGRLAKEAEILKRIGDRLGSSQRRVIRSQSGILETADGESTAFMELEYLDGVTLDSWMAEWLKGPLRPWEERLEQAARFGLELAEALEELETVGIIHRDVKPNNIMVTSDGLRLFDFNIATDEEAAVTHTKCIGTPGYQAPEVRLGKTYDRRADMFSIGLIMWGILHQRKMDVARELDKGMLEYVVDWPSSECDAIPSPAAEALEQLMTGLLCDAPRRIAKPPLVKDRCTQILKMLRPQHPPLDEILNELDLIQLIFELRASGQASVVADLEDNGPLENYVRAKTRVEDPLENYLVQRIQQSLEGATGAPKLLMLSGNAGDGKSYLIDRLVRHHFANADSLDTRIAYIADATHALNPTQSQQNRLEEFFAPFADNAETGPTKDLYLIAMNTGMVIRFFERAMQRWANDEPGALDFASLYETLQGQLGLNRRSSRAPAPGVEVVNLDLRSLVGGDANDSFVLRMLEKLEPNLDGGFLTAHYGRCTECSARHYCPVRFNIEALSRPEVSQGIAKFLHRAAIEPEVHLSPRNMWDFFYRLITGGTERFETAGANAATAPCKLVRQKVLDKDFPWLLRGHLTELMFNSSDRGPIWRALASMDPAYRTVPDLDKLQTRLSVRAQLDTESDTIRGLGGDGGTLAGLAIKALLEQLPNSFPASERRNAAVRRQVMLHADTLVNYFTFGGFNRFDELLDAYSAFSHGAGLTREQEDALLGVGDLVQKAVVQSYGRRIGESFMLRVSQPNSRSSSHLLVEAKDLAQKFKVANLVQKDLHILAHLEDGRQQLLGHLRYRPSILTLDVAGNRLMVDQSVYEFLLRVEAGQQPSAFDLAQFQALRYIAERLGNELARGANELFVIDKDGQLFCLSQNEFGRYAMNQVEKYAH